MRKSGEKMNAKKLIGMRTLKTGIAVTITALLALTSIINNQFYAIFGTLFGMQNTVTDSLTLGTGRIFGILTGATIGFIFVSFGLTSPPFIGIAIICVIIASQFFKLLSDSVFITFTLCVSIMVNPREEGLILYTLMRVLDTSIGLVIGVIVNYFIAQPNYLKDLTLEINKIHNLTKETINNLSDKTKLSTLENELKKLKILNENFTVDEKYDKHDISIEKLQTTIKSCDELYFHIKCLNRLTDNIESPIYQYHLKTINETLNLLENTSTELFEQL